MFTGMKKSACHPRLAYECAQILANHYPERLGRAFCVLPGAAFRAAWKAIKVFLPATTIAKVGVISSQSKLQPALEQLCSPETTNWLLTEISQNSLKAITPRQRQFWLPPTPDTKCHDTRGTQDYVDGYISSQHVSEHKPHPNVVDELAGALGQDQLNASVDDGSAMEEDEEGDYDDDEGFKEDEDETTVANFIINLPSAHQIPEDACTLP